VVITTTTLDELPDLELDSQIVCEGEVITLYAFSDDAISYQWNTGETTEFLEVTEEGTYSVTVTDINGCTASASADAAYGDIEIALNVSVSEPFLLSEDPLKVWQGAAIELDVDVSGTEFPYEVLWNRGPEIGDTILNYIAQESGEVTVAIIDSIGCIGLDTLAFEVRPYSIFIPTAFSPNGDNINDWFNVYTSPNVEEVRLQLFSRTGSLIFDGLRLEAQMAGDGLLWQGWNGRFNGTLLPPQVFVYQLTFRPLRGEWQQLSGDVTLVR
jgi:gliding motility-associated-like protein